MNLRWTDAGRAALLDAANVGTAAVKLAALALGDGHGAGGAADDSRTALRSERHRADLSGASAAGKIAARADFNPDASYGVTEVGVFATVGDPPGAPFLALYWTDGGAEAAKAAKGAALAVAATIEFQNAGADVAVEVATDITFGNIDEATATAFGTTRYASQAETGGGAAANRAITPAGLKAAIGKVAAFLLGKAATDGTIYQLKGKAGGGLLAEPRTLPDATATQKGIVELATADEAKKGTDAARAVTPKALKAATDALSVPSAPATATTGRKGIVELATTTETESGSSSSRAITPAGLKAAIGKVAAFLLGRAATDGTIYQLKGKAGGGLLAEPRTLPDATATQKGIVELATADEAKKGADTTRAVTPAGLKSATDALPKGLADKVPAAGNADKTYVIKRAKSSSGGGLSIVEAVFRRYVTPGNHNFVVPAGVTRLRLLLIGAGGGGGGSAGTGRSGIGETHTPETPGGPGGPGGGSAVRRGAAELVTAGGGAGGPGGAIGGVNASAVPGGAGAPGRSIQSGAGSGVYGSGGSGADGVNLFSFRSRGAGGGAAGAAQERTIDVTPGETLAITVGRGGAGGGRGRARTGTNGVGHAGIPGSAGGNGFVQMING